MSSEGKSTQSEGGFQGSIATATVVEDEKPKVNHKWRDLQSAHHVTQNSLAFGIPVSSVFL